MICCEVYIALWCHWDLKVTWYIRKDGHRQFRTALQSLRVYYRLSFLFIPCRCNVSSFSIQEFSFSINLCCSVALPCFLFVPSYIMINSAYLLRPWFWKFLHIKILFAVFTSFWWSYIKWSFLMNFLVARRPLP